MAGLVFRVAWGSEYYGVQISRDRPYQCHYESSLLVDLAR